MMIMIKTMKMIIIITTKNIDYQVISGFNWNTKQNRHSQNEAVLGRCIKVLLLTFFFLHKKRQLIFFGFLYSPDPDLDADHRKK